AEAGSAVSEELGVAGFEPPIGSVAVSLEPPPASERIPASDGGDVANTDRSHDFVPARRECKVTAGLDTQAPRRVRPPSEDLLRREVVVRILELKRARKSRAIVMLGNTAEWKQRL